MDNMVPAEMVLAFFLLMFCFGCSFVFFCRPSVLCSRKGFSCIPMPLSCLFPAQIHDYANSHKGAEVLLCFTFIPLASHRHQSLLAPGFFFDFFIYHALVHLTVVGRRDVDDQVFLISLTGLAVDRRRVGIVPTEELGLLLFMAL